MKGFIRLLDIAYRYSNHTILLIFIATTLYLNWSILNIVLFALFVWLVATPKYKNASLYLAMLALAAFIAYKLLNRFQKLDELAHIFFFLLAIYIAVIAIEYLKNKIPFLKIIILVSSFMIIIIFGKNILGGDWNKTGYLSPFYSGYYELTIKNQDIRIAKHQMEKGGLYHLMMNFDYSSNIENKESSSNPLLVGITLPDNGFQEIGKIQKKTNNQTFEITFMPQDDSTMIALKKIGDGNENITIHDVKIDKINDSGTATVIANYPDYSNIVYANDTDKTNQSSQKIYDIVDKNALVGQVVRFDHDVYMNSAAFEMRFVGNGGKYKHTLVVKSITKENEKYKIGRNNHASYQFYSEFATNFLKEPSKSKYYRFPIGYKFEKDKLYFIGFQNSAATNFTNHIRLFGAKTKDNNSIDAIATDGRKFNTIGKINLKIYGEYQKTYDGYPYGAYIINKGNSEGRYEYRSEKDIMHEALIANDISYRIYKINAKYRIKTAEISIANFNSDSGDKIFISTNQSDWKEIDKTFINSGKQFSAPTNTPVLYIKTTQGNPNEAYMKNAQMELTELNAKLETK